MAHTVATTSTCFILTGSLLLLLHHTHAQDQDISLSSSLHTNQRNVSIARPGEVATFLCTVRGSSVLAWSSAEYIRDRIEFLVAQRNGTMVTSGFASAVLIEAYHDENGQPVLMSQLRIIVQRSILNSSVTCHHSGRDLTKTIAFKLSNTPVLTARKICPEEHWIFMCEIRDSSILAWESDMYIGENGKRLEFLSAEAIGTMKSKGEVSAVLIGSYVENYIQVLNSQLTIPNYQYHSDAAAVACVNVGLETRSSTFGLTSYNCNATGTTTDDSPLVPTDALPTPTTKIVSTRTVGDGIDPSEDRGVVVAISVASAVGTIIILVSVVVMLTIVFYSCRISTRIKEYD